MFTCNNVNSAFLRFLIMSLIYIFTYCFFISFVYFVLQLSKHFNITWFHDIIDQNRVSHARMTNSAELYFLLCPMIHIFTSFLACISVTS